MSAEDVRIDWLVSFFENQKNVKCSCCSDCDNERDAAEAEIVRLAARLQEAERENRVLTLAHKAAWLGPIAELEKELAEAEAHLAQLERIEEAAKRIRPLTTRKWAMAKKRSDAWVEMDEELSLALVNLWDALAATEEGPTVEGTR